MASVAGAATCPEFGYGFRAYPFAERLLGFMNVRVYDVSAARAIARHPEALARPASAPRDARLVRHRGPDDVLAPEPAPDRRRGHGTRLTVDYKSSARFVDALDWRLMG